MNIYDFHGHLENSDNFAEGGILHCLDATYAPQENSLVPTIRRKIVPDHELADWTSNSSFGDRREQESPLGPKMPYLRIIALEDPKHTARLNWTELPLLLRKESFDLITSSFHISPFFLTAALNQEAVYHKAYQKIEDVGARAQYVFRTYSTRKGRFCLGLTHQPGEMTTTAFISGLLNEEIQELFRLVEARTLLLAAPMLIPTILAGFALTYLRDRLYHCHTTSNIVKHRMGLAFDLKNASFGEASVDKSMELSQSLTSLFSKLAKYDQHSRSLLDLFCVSDEANTFCLEVSAARRNFQIAEASEYVQAMISFMTSATESSKNWVVLLQRRTQGYMQIVHSLVAQRDNSLNIQLATSSLRIAEIARSDNLAMKAIAEDSKVVAVESLRKNDLMRFIAMVTMLFLPATFIATFFSTNFFNFQSRDGLVVSHWIWLYVLITVIMTAGIQCVWFFKVRQSRTPSEGIEPSKLAHLANENVTSLARG